MLIKKLLVPLFESPDDRNAILRAVEVATPLGAHVTAMFSGGHLSELVSAEPPSYVRVKPHLQIAARTLLAEQVEAARNSFESLVREHGFTIADAPGADAPGGHPGATLSFEAHRGLIEATIREAAVFHDLVVFYRDTEKAEVELQGLTTIKSALQSCARPLLILPRNLPRPFASTIAIGWNGSIEGAHAVSSALPLLALAKSVHVLTVTTQKTAVEQAQKLQSYLEWHGIRSEVHSSGRDGATVGATLLGRVEAVGADLFVLGGYTHSRIRENILGGVTHHVVQHARVPVLLSR
ncbi:MAG: universal stress protein [Gammaproteobacteria bacterium]